MSRAQDVPPPPEKPFGGFIHRKADDSVKDSLREVPAPKGAPNVPLILAHDVGFGASSTFGGPIPAASMDRLARNGLRYLGGRPVFRCKRAGVQRTSVAAKEKLAPGEHVIVVEFVYDGGGLGKGAAIKMTVDKEPVAEGCIDRSIATLFAERSCHEQGGLCNTLA